MARNASGAKTKADIAKAKHEKGDYGPDELDDLSLGGFGTDYRAAYKDWKDKYRASVTARDNEAALARELQDREGKLERARVKAEDAARARERAEQTAGQDNAAAQEKVDRAKTELDKAAQQQQEARDALDKARTSRESAEKTVQEAKTKVLARAREIDSGLAGHRDDEARSSKTVADTTERRDRAQRDLDGAETDKAATASRGDGRVQTAKDLESRRNREASDARDRLDSTDSRQRAAATEAASRKQDVDRSVFDHTMRTSDGSDPNTKEASGLKFLGRDRIRTSATKEVDKREIDRDVKTELGMGGSTIDIGRGFEGDIADPHAVDASALKAGVGEGANGVFFQSVRGKNKPGANAQAYLADARASAGAMSQGGDWAKGDVIGAHAQAKARASAAGAAASANSTAEGGPAFGAIDPITGKRQGMLGAEAGIDADVRLMEAGASADAQASVQGTRAQASAEVAADASLVSAKGGANAKAGVNLGGWKLAGAEVGAEGSAMVGARGSAEAGAQVGLGGVKAKAAGEVMAGAEAEGQVQAKMTTLGIDNSISAEGRAMAGAEASGEVGGSLSLADGDAFTKAEGEAFIGAKAEGSVKMGYGLGDMDLLTMTLHGEVQAGAGVSGAFIAGMVDGAMELYAEASLALGVGAGAGLGFNVGVFTPVKYALQLLNDNGVISNDADDWIPQMVELGKTGKVLRSQQQGIDGFGGSQGVVAPTKPAAGAGGAAGAVGGAAGLAGSAAGAVGGAAGLAGSAAGAVGGAAGLAGSAAGAVGGAAGLAGSAAGAAGSAAGAAGSTVITGGPAPLLAAPDMAAAPPEQGASPRYAEPRGSAASVMGDMAEPVSPAGMQLLAKPDKFDLDEIGKVADKEPAFGELGPQIDKAQGALADEMAPLQDLEGRWLEGFNDEAGSLVDSVASPLQDLWGLVDGAISGVSALLSGDLQGALAAGQGLVEGAGEIISGAWALLQQFFTDPIGAIHSFFAKFEALRAGAEAVFGGLLSGMGSLTDLFEGKIGPARALSGMIRGMAEGVTDILVDHGHEAADDVREVGDKADEVLGREVDREALPGVALELDDGARDAIDEDAERIEDVGEDASDMVLDVIDDAAAHVDGYIEDAVAYATGLVGDAIAGAQNAFESVKNAVISQVTDVKSSLLVRAAQMIAERIAAAARAVAAFFGWHW